jgi:putative cell wall-binding protein
MAKDPAVLFYTQDFLVGTLTMTNEQVGKYIRLLCLQHQKGKLTLKDLKQYINEEDIEVAEKFIKDDDGFYYNIKLKNETERRKNYSESRRNNRMKNISKSYDKHMETVTVTETGTVNLELKLETGNTTKAEREDILADAITGSLDKEQKEIINKFDNIFGDVN